MMLSVMVVGAGAAFSDQSKIKNTEAVDMCTALNIIGGYPDGTFKPEGNITRAEVTKMICVALNGGKEPNLATNATPTFSDVRTNANCAWAEKYIESCVAQGIVSGVGGGKFAPAGNVTGTQLAKMLLVSLGYKADVQNFTGNAWATNVNVLATQKGLYKGLESMDPAAALTRDNAAQMIWNALQAKEVEYKYTLVTENGNLTSKVTVEDKQVNGRTITLLADKYEAEDDFEGTLVSYKWDDKDKEFDYEVLVTDTDVVNDVSGVTKGVSYKFSTTADYTDLFGLNVKVIYKTNKDKDVYGMFANDSAILAQGVVDDLEAYDKDTIKFDGVKYDTDADIALAALPVVAENQWPTNNATPKEYVATITNTYNTLVTARDETAKAYTAKLIDVDNDGEADYVVYLPFSVAKVNSVGSKTVSLTEGQMDAPTSLKFDDDTIYSGIAKDDYVKIVAEANSAYDGYTVTKMDAVKGIVTGTKSNQIQVEGKWYTVPSTSSISVSSTLNNEYTFYVVGSFAYYSDSVSVSLTNVLYVFDTDKGLSDQAKVYFTDGTSSTVTVKEVQDDNGKEWGSTSSSVDESANFAANGNVAGKLYTYTVKNNEYTLKEIGDNNDLGYTWDGDIEGEDAVISAAKDNKAGKLGDYAIADDAVVFIQYKENGKDKVKVVSGATAKDYKTAVGGQPADAETSQPADAAAVLYKTTNGVDTAQVAMLITSNNGKLPSSKGESDNYGYVVADAYGTKIDGDDYYKFTIWNGSKDVEVYTDNNAADGLKKGAVIKYSDVGNGEIDDVIVLTAEDPEIGDTEFAGIVAIKGISGKTLVTTEYGTDGDDTDEYYLTKDTVYLYVDTENHKGEDTGSINTAIQETEDSSTYYKGNACIYVDSTTDNEITLIVVDTSNDWDGLTYGA